MKTNPLTLRSGLAALALSLGFSAAVQAQTNDDRDVNARFGIKGGINLTNLYRNEKLDDNNLKPGFQAGVFVRKPFAEIFAIQPELLFSNKGAKLGYTNTVFGCRSGTLNLNYIEVPVLLKVSPLPFLSFHAGPYASYLVNANVSKDQYSFDGSSSQTDTQLNTDAFNTVDYGAAAGAELNLGIVDIGARYNLGMRKVGRSAEGQRFTGNGYNQNISLYLALVF